MFIPWFFSTASAFATTWHVDSKGGNDAAAGISQATACKTLRRVNKAKIAPGDKVLFKRGGLWRGKLRPASGEEGKPVVYSWYGKGPKPIAFYCGDGVTTFGRLFDEMRR